MAIKIFDFFTTRTTRETSFIPKDNKTLNDITFGK